MTAEALDCVNADQTASAMKAAPDCLNWDLAGNRGRVDDSRLVLLLSHIFSSRMTKYIRVTALFNVPLLAGQLTPQFQAYPAIGM